MRGAHKQRVWVAMLASAEDVGGWAQDGIRSRGEAAKNFLKKLGSLFATPMPNVFL